MTGSIVLLDKNTRGLTISLDIERLGYYGVSICSLAMNNCLISEDEIIGGQSMDASVLLADVKLTDLLNYSARAIGMAQCLLDTTITYCGSKKTEDRCLKDIPQVRLRLAELESRFACMKMIFSYFLLKKDLEDVELVNAYAAKIFTTETAADIAKMAMQLHGGAGYMKNMLIERLLRDILALSLIGTSTEIAIDKISQAISC